MKKHLSFILLCAVMTVYCGKLSAQVVPAKTTTPEPATVAAPVPQPISLTWTGYVKTDFFIDSRQTAVLREGSVLFFPSAVDPDATGQDKNAVPSYNSLSVQSRIRLNAAGPEYFGFKANAAIEAEFFGNAEADENGLRLRHAFVQLTNSKVQLLFGQFWHPFYTPECAPSTLNFSTGAPFSTFTRNPQFRITTTGATKFFGALLTERDFTTPGPAAATANIATPYVRNDLIPIVDFGFQSVQGNVTFGATVDIKSIKPRTSVSFTNASKTVINTTTDTRMVGVSANAYFQVKTKDVTFKASTIYSQNGSDMLLLGGYAESAIDSTTGKYSYTTMNAISAWVELSGKKNAFEWGVFAGYVANLGLSDPLSSTVKGPGIYQFSLNTNVINAYRISPRVGWRSGKVLLGVELDVTTAQRSRALLPGESTLTALPAVTVANGSVVNVDQSTNARLLFTAQYNF